jgi:hypothetical protein
MASLKQLLVLAFVAPISVPLTGGCGGDLSSPADAGADALVAPDSAADVVVAHDSGVDAPSAHDASTDAWVSPDAGADAIAPADAGADVSPGSDAGDGGSCAASGSAQACITCCEAASPGAGAFPLYFVNCCNECPGCPDIDPCSPMPSASEAGACLACLAPKLGPQSSCDTAQGEWKACTQAAWPCTAFVACLQSCPMQ